jgi:8-oxo-dGTP diphosphatase
VRHAEGVARYTPILGTLVYVLDRASNSVLLVHRVARQDDEHLGKWNGLGGKLETHEDVVSGAIREVAEEASIDLTSVTLRGTVNWPGFSADGSDWFGFVFLADAWTGTPATVNDEGNLEWIGLDRLLAACSTDETTRTAANLPMWEGDAHFLPLVFDNDPRAFHGVMPYTDGRPTDWRFSRVS